jgi:hypothetical protein
LSPHLFVVLIDAYGPSASWRAVREDERFGRPEPCEQLPELRTKLAASTSRFPATLINGQRRMHST